MITVENYLENNIKKSNLNPLSKVSFHLKIKNLNFLFFYKSKLKLLQLKDVISYYFWIKLNNEDS
jgi:hypothetical protein